MGIVEIKKWEKCSKDLPFSAAERTIKCSFCGQVHEIKAIKYERRTAKSDSQENVTSEVAEGIIETLLDSFFD